MSKLKASPNTSTAGYKGSPPRIRWRRGRFTPIWLITVLLFLLSPLLAPGSLSQTTLTSMLPFAGILAIVALGQTLVMSQGGIDLSVPGSMALAAVLATKLPELGVPLPYAITLALLAGAVGGLVIGMAVVQLSVAAFIAGLAMNSILLGAVLYISNGFPAAAEPSLSSFAVSSPFGVPILLLISVVVVGVAHWAVRHTIPGRRLIAVGAGRPAARLLGLKTRSYEMSAYLIAGLAYSLAGVLLAGLLRTPNIMLGDSYLLPSIAAVVLGGSLLTGGIINLAATGVAALFLTQLGQVVLVSGASTSMQLLVQAVVLALSVVLRGVSWKKLMGQRPGSPRIKEPI